MFDHRKIASNSSSLERRRLYDLLKRPRWSDERAVMILAGVSPESPGKCDGEEYLYYTLPGTLAYYNCRRSDRHEFHQSLCDEMDELRGFVRVKSNPPEAWIKEADGQKYFPPWLSLLRDAGCDWVLKAEEPELALSANATHAANTRHGNSVYREYQRLLLPDWHRQRHPLNRAEMFEFRRKHQDAFKTHMGSDWKPGSDRTIDKWVRELDYRRRGKKAERWIEEVISQLR